MLSRIIDTHKMQRKNLVKREIEISSSLSFVKTRYALEKVRIQFPETWRNHAWRLACVLIALLPGKDPIFENRVSNPSLHFNPHFASTRPPFRRRDYSEVSPSPLVLRAIIHIDDDGQRS